MDITGKSYNSYDITYISSKGVFQSLDLAKPSFGSERLLKVSLVQLPVNLMFPSVTESNRQRD